MKTVNGFTYGNVGSISSGTMRTEDLIPDFLWELKRLAMANKNQSHLDLVAEIQSRIDAGENDENDNPYWDSDDASYDLNDSLFDALNEYALPYFYFGSHPGDGSDYGFWLSDELEFEFEGLKVEDTSEVPDDYKGEVLYVNDHGNMTLFSANKGELTEIWGIV